MTPKLSAIVILWVLALAIIPMHLLQDHDREADKNSIPADLRSAQATATPADAQEADPSPTACLSSNELDAEAVEAALQSSSAPSSGRASPAHSAHPQTQP